MSQLKGTPKTLAEAIQNGIENLPDTNGGNWKAARFVIEDHVLDFLRQKFGSAYLQADGHVYMLAILQNLARETGVESEKTQTDKAAKSQRSKDHSNSQS